VHRAATSRCLLAVALVSAAVPASLIAAVPALGQQQPTPTPSAVIDGPSPDVIGLSGMSVARDGTGGVVYLKQVGGVAHVFVSRLLGGVFRTPEEVDAALPGPSSQPVIAAGNGGLLLVGFINGGQLYVVTRVSAGSAASGPLAIAGGASNPSISISNFGKAYLAFTVAGAGGHDVRAAYYYAGAWALESAPLDAVSSDDAGVGSGRPDVTAAGDGVGIVAWGEAGHIDTRRVWARSPSTVYEQADPPSVGGWNEISADEPALSASGDSSYATVVFHEVLSDGSQTQSRVFSRRLHGSQYDGLANADGLGTPGADGAVQPQVTVSEYGAGFITSARDDTHALYAMSLGKNGANGPVAQVDSLPNATAPDGVPAMAGLYSTMIAWQHDPGAPGMPEIRVRYAPDGSTLGPELALSTPALGPTDADGGLAAAGDVSGDAVVAWLQGIPGSLAIVADQLYQAPGGLSPSIAFTYARTARPRLSWSAARDLWGPVHYTVAFDGAQLPTTTSTSLVVPEPLADGRHTWQVAASNPAGLTRSSRVAAVWVDTVPPVGKVRITGARYIGTYLHLTVAYTDAPPPEPPSSASGIAKVTVNWGDGSVYTITHGKYHAYKRRGRYRVTVTITDRAGNTTRLVQTLRITPKPKPPPKSKAKPRPKPRHVQRRAPAPGRAPRA
jgi:hypothetical protein